MIIRRAVESDAAAVADVIGRVACERQFSAIDRAFSAEEERSYIASLSAREGVFIALTEDGQVTGVQTLEQWARTIGSMWHVGQIGTFIPSDMRRRGIGRSLFRSTASFAIAEGYRKFVIQIRASNTPALSFYQDLGFQICGRFSRQVVMDGVEDDEILLELFL